LRELGIARAQGTVHATLGNRPIRARLAEAGLVHFNEPVALRAGDTLTVRLAAATADKKTAAGPAKGE
jgi:hypothetical protein